MSELKLVFFEQMSAIGNRPVHHGDCTLVFLPDGQTLLIDAGQLSVGTHLAQQILALGVKHIDYFLISHLHGDHTAGFPEVAEKISFGRVLYAGYGEDNPFADQTGLAEIRRRRIPMEMIAKGQVLNFGGAALQVLAPDPDAAPAPEGLTRLEYNDILNQHSTVIRMSYGKFAMLFPGDIHQEAEKKLVEEYGDALACTVLKIPHHGHIHSCTSGFLGAVRPHLALHMGKDMDAPVMQAFTSRCIPIYSTALDGCIVFDTDGSMLRVSCAKGERMIEL